MDNCCDSLLKYLIFIFNFFFFVAGLALISVGAYVHLQMSDYLNFMDDSYLNASILFIIAGAIIVIIAFFGCCGACTESPCMMFTFATLLAIMIIVQIGAAITVYMFQGEAHTVISEKMTEGLNNYDRGEEFAGVTDTWNAIESDFKCCGVSNYSDWRNTPFGGKTRGVPDSCCKDETANCGSGIFQDKDIGGINQVGCFKLLEKTVEDNVTLVGGIGIGFAVVQIIGVLVSCMLAGNMKRRSNYV